MARPRPTIRPARPDDREPIVAFTRDTFRWGDYIDRVFDTWLADPDGALLVAADDHDRPVGMAKVSLVSPDEAWLQGARVHPDHRRQGIGAALNRASVAWAADRGARVARLVVEDWNEPARAQVTALGYRPVARWVAAVRRLGTVGDPDPSGNGGRRLPADAVLQRAPRAEAEPATIAWSSSGLARAAHGLFPRGWVWRRLGLADVEAAARERTLWHAPPGWAIGRLEATEPDDERDATFRIDWFATTPDDLHGLLRAIADRGAREGVVRLEVMAPEAPWVTDELERSGYELHPMTVYELPILGSG